MAIRLSLLCEVIQSIWLLSPRPPQPICTQLSLLFAPCAARRFGACSKRVADNAPVATAVRLRNKRRFREFFMNQYGGDVSHGCGARATENSAEPGAPASLPASGHQIRRQECRRSQEQAHFDALMIDVAGEFPKLPPLPSPLLPRRRGRWLTESGSTN